MGSKIGSLSVQANRTLIPLSEDDDRLSDQPAEDKALSVYRMATRRNFIGPIGSILVGGRTARKTEQTGTVWVIPAKKL